MRKFLSRFSLGLVAISSTIGGILLAGGNDLGVFLILFSLMMFLMLTIPFHVNGY